MAFLFPYMWVGPTNVCKRCISISIFFFVGFNFLAPLLLYIYYTHEHTSTRAHIRGPRGVENTCCSWIMYNFIVFVDSTLDTSITLVELKNKKKKQILLLFSTVVISMMRWRFYLPKKICVNKFHTIVKMILFPSLCVSIYPWRTIDAK